MNRNGITLSVILVVLATIYVVKFTDWFRKQNIQIIPQIRPLRAAGNQRNPSQERVYPVSFSFDSKYKLTSVKVVAADDLATNKYPVPLWHLVSDSNSLPTKYVVYGYPIKGMKPAAARSKPEPLQPDVRYVLLLEAGDIKASTNFRTLSATAATQTGQ
jgi:hypothetical protein